VVFLAFLENLRNLVSWNQYTSHAQHDAMINKQMEQILALKM